MSLRCIGVLLALLIIVVSVLGIDSATQVKAQENVLFVVEGTVEVLEPDLIVVDGFKITPAGIFLPASLAVGDYVTVTGYLLEDDTLKVISIELADRDESGDNGQGQGQDKKKDKDAADDDDIPVIDENESDNNGNGQGQGHGNGQNKNKDKDDDSPVADEDESDNNGQGHGQDKNKNKNADNDSDNQGNCQRDDHPVIEALATDFEIAYDVIQEWHCAGAGLGGIVRALLIAEQSGVSAEAILEMHAGGMGWGVIMNGLGISPNSLAPGRVISSHNKDKNHGQSGEDHGQSDEDHSQDKQD